MRASEQQGEAEARQCSLRMDGHFSSVLVPTIGSGVALPSRHDRALLRACLLLPGVSYVLPVCRVPLLRGSSWVVTRPWCNRFGFDNGKALQTGDVARWEGGG